MTLEAQVIAALHTLKAPRSDQTLWESGQVQGLKVTAHGNISFSLEVNTASLGEGVALKEQAETLFKKIPGITDIQIVLTAQRKPKVHNPSQEKIPGIRHIIAVASGKGGVGKSTTAVNLACGLQSLSLKVGLLDGDIYGPSLPRLLGINEKPLSEDGKTITPLQAHGLKCMSIGFMMEETAPVIWRGPMVQAAFLQMLCQVNWGELDVLVIDLPPGTGDVHLSLAQRVLVSGVLIVSTPQDLALIEARKAYEMFLKVEVPTLGFIENMSYFLCPHCEERSDIFGNARQAAEALGVPLLGTLPLHMEIREASDQGVPLAIQRPESPHVTLYQDLARTLWERLNFSSP